MSRTFRRCTKNKIPYEDPGSEPVFKYISDGSYWYYVNSKLLKELDNSKRRSYTHAKLQALRIDAGMFDDLVIPNIFEDVWNHD